MKNDSIKFKRWQKRVCKQTRFLCELVEERVVSFFEKSGFDRVDIVLNRPDQPVPVNEIRLERTISDKIDSISVSFTKRGEPRFQIGFSRRELKFPNEFVVSACLVKKQTQYYYFWGKPWWIPLRLWSDTNSSKTVAGIVPLLPQILEFLDQRGRGKNIGLEV